MQNIDKAVGNRIKSRRTELNLSQTELATCVGVKFQQVQKYESGSNRASASRLWKIAGALHVHVSYFFDELVKLETSDDAPALNLNDQYNKLKRSLDFISEPKHQAIPALIETFQNENSKPGSL